MKVNQELAILFWLWKQKADTAGKAPIYARLTIDGLRIQFSLGQRVLPAQFNKQSGMVKGSSDDAKSINSYLILVKGKLQQHYNLLVTQNDVVTPEMVRDAFIGKSDAQKTLLQAFTYHNEQFEQKVKAGIRARASLVKFKTTFDHLKAFIKKEFGHGYLPLANLKHSFAEDFEHYLTITEKPQNNSAMKHIRNIMPPLK